MDYNAQLTQDFFFLLELNRTPDEVFPKNSTSHKLSTAWMDRLCREQFRTTEERRIRNIYLSHLCVALVQGELYGPFLQMPSKSKLEKVDFNYKPRETSLSCGNATEEQRKQQQQQQQQQANAYCAAGEAGAKQEPAAKDADAVGSKTNDEVGCAADGPAAGEAKPEATQQSAASQPAASGASSYPLNTCCMQCNLPYGTVSFYGHLKPNQNYQGYPMTAPQSDSAAGGAQPCGQASYAQQQPYGRTPCAQQQPCGAVRAVQQPCGAVGAVQQPCGAVGAVQQPCGAVGAVQQPCGAVGAVQQPCGQARYGQAPCGQAPCGQAPCGPAQSAQQPRGPAPSVQQPCESVDRTQRPFGPLAPVPQQNLQLAQALQSSGQMQPFARQQLYAPNAISNALSQLCNAIEPAQQPFGPLQPISQEYSVWSPPTQDSMATGMTNAPIHTIHTIPDSRAYPALPYQQRRMIQNAPNQIEQTDCIGGRTPAPYSYVNPANACACPPAPCDCTGRTPQCTCDRSTGGYDKTSPDDCDTFSNYLLKKLKCTPELLAEFDATLKSLIDLCNKSKTLDNRIVSNDLDFFLSSSFDSLKKTSLQSADVEDACNIPHESNSIASMDWFMKFKSLSSKPETNQVKEPTAATLIPTPSPNASKLEDPSGSTANPDNFTHHETEGGNAGERRQHKSGKGDAIVKLLMAISSELRGAAEPGCNDFLEGELARYKQFLNHFDIFSQQFVEFKKVTSDMTLRNFLLLRLQQDLVKMLSENID